MARLFHPVDDPPPPKVRLEGAGFHHLVHVLRLKAGDAVEIFDGRGRSFSGR
ncbi:MAG TPA: RNA methyltransferase PUA domain-containing protein, partial [Myxococcaceae bacterium]|nr:RNA methyltransferase PUA domain-containing protein [Myxococcaceae bacterium]